MIQTRKKFAPTVSHLTRFALALAGGVSISFSAQAQWTEQDCTAIHTLVGESPGDQFGWVANPIGDVTADGICDFVVTAPTNDANGNSSGRIYVYDGATAQELWRATGPNVGVLLGHDATSAGDWNADGSPDVIAGAPNGGAGMAIIYDGRTGTIIHTFSGENTADRFGYRVFGGGDFDGDGTDDVVIGARWHDTAGVNAGRAYVYSGADRTLICTIDGDDTQDTFGSGVCFVGDVTGDSRDDICIGAQNAGNGGGLAYVYSWDGAQCNREYTLAPNGNGIAFGLWFMNGDVDVNADGTPDIYVNDFQANRAYIFSGVDGSLIWALDGNNEGGQFGIGRIIDDINGDGHADAIMAAWVNGQGASNAGKAYVYSGIDGSVLQTMTYTVPGAGFGFDAAGMCGDVNGDGAADYLITAASEAGSIGKVFVMAGTVGGATDICPTSFNRVRGIAIGGDLNSLCTADDDYLSTRPDVFAATIVPPVQVEMLGAATDRDPAELRFLYEGSIGDSPVLQRISLFNYATAQWELLDSQVGTTSDSEVQIVVSSNASRFINQDTGEMKALVQFTQLSLDIPPTWPARIDRANWRIIPQ